MLTLTSALQNTIRLHGTKPAIVDAEGNLTWSEYGQSIARSAGMLRDLGLNAGQRFGIFCRNCRRQGELIYAGYWSGAVPVPINCRLAPGEIAQILDDAECRQLAIDPAFMHILEHPAMASWRGRAFALGPELKGTDIPFFDDLRAAAEPLEATHMDELDDALMLYTGGTTGGGKGVKISHRNIVSNALQIMQAVKPHESDVYMHTTPMFHAAEVKSTIFTMFGSSHCYLPGFTPKDFFAAIERYRATVVGLVPTTVLSVLDEPTRGEYDLSSLRLISYGASPILPPVIRRTIDAFPGVGLQQCYGLTECAPYLAMLDEEAHKRGVNGEEHILTSAGRPVPGVDLRIVDDAGHEVPTGGIGEIVVRGPQVSVGYHNRPIDHAAAFKEDGFYTGDVGRLDVDGFLYLVDRKRDMIISGGENIYTREVEEIIGRHDGVREVSVIGVPDRKFGEALFAIIVPAPDWRPSSEELIGHCREHIGSYKIPRSMVFVEELPKSAMGKVLKHDLRKTYACQPKQETAL